MIAIDTNIVVRLLTKDDAEQYQKAYRLFEQQPIFISETVILETEWVLRFAYQFSREQIIDALRKLLGLPNVTVNYPAIVDLALTWHAQGLDFADALHLANSQHCDTFFTFDKKMINAAKHISEREVISP